MCWLFHKWGKWSDIKEEGWEKWTTYHGVMVGGKTEFQRMVQIRECERCNKVERNYLD